MARTLREPLPVGPFLWWCHRRVVEIERELDLPANKRNLPFQEGPQCRLLFEIGWHGEHDSRRLYRWAHETPSGLVERGLVEDALDHADVDFYEVYWTVLPPAETTRVGFTRRMTDAQVLAAHTVYWRGEVSLGVLGEMLWERYGYANAESCEDQLRRAFISFGLPRRLQAEASALAHFKHGLCRNGRRAALYQRVMDLQRYGQCTAERKDGSQCPRAAKPGTEHCGYHQPEEVARRQAQIELVNAQGRNVWNRVDRQGAAA